jgi:hypothetical protein
MGHSHQKAEHPILQFSLLRAPWFCLYLLGPELYLQAFEEGSEKSRRTEDCDHLIVGTLRVLFVGRGEQE